MSFYFDNQTKTERNNTTLHHTWNDCAGKVPSACDSNPCNWMGSCVDEMDGGYMCHCYDGTHGPSCDGGMNMAGTWCMTGERVSMKIPFEGNDQWVNIVNNAAFTRCPEEWGMQCVHYSVNGTTPSGEGQFLYLYPLKIYDIASDIYVIPKIHRSCILSVLT